MAQERGCPVALCRTLRPTPCLNGQIVEDHCCQIDRSCAQFPRKQLPVTLSDPVWIQPHQPSKLSLMPSRDSHPKYSRYMKNHMGQHQYSHSVDAMGFEREALANMFHPVREAQNRPLFQVNCCCRF